MKKTECMLSALTKIYYRYSIMESFWEVLPDLLSELMSQTEPGQFWIILVLWLTFVKPKPTIWILALFLKKGGGDLAKRRSILKEYMESFTGWASLITSQLQHHRCYNYMKMAHIG